MNDFMLLVGAPLSFLLLYGIHCFLPLPALFQYFTFFFFLEPPPHLRAAATSPQPPSSQHKRSLSIPPLVFPRLSFFFFSPFALSISPTQSLLSHGSRCSVRCLLHSACSLARKPVNQGQNASDVFFFARPRVRTHNSEPLDTNTLEEHFFCSFFFFWPTFIWHVVPLMVLVELN